MPDVGESSSFVIPMYFGFFRSIDVTDQIGYIITQPVLSIIDPASVDVDAAVITMPAYTGHTSVNVNGGVVLTNTQSKTFQDPTGAQKLGGKSVGRIAISCPLTARAQYAPATVFDIRLTTNCKVEILDGATVKATLSLPIALASVNQSQLNTAVSHILCGVVDLNGYVFTTDIRVKVTIESTVTTTTNMTNHTCNFLIIQNVDTDGAAIVRCGKILVELLN